MRSVGELDCLADRGSVYWHRSSSRCLFGTNPAGANQAIGLNLVRCRTCRKTSAGEPKVAVDRAAISVSRAMTFLQAARQLNLVVSRKTMLATSPITWNGIVPRSRNPDPLWDVMSGILVLIADRGQRIRWRSKPGPIALEVHVLVNGTWYEMVPPLWKMQHLVKRLVALTSRSWWDWFGLWRGYRCHIRGGEPLAWERSVTIVCHGEPLLAACRVDCIGDNATVEIEIVAATEVTSAAAAASVAEFVKRLPFSEMVETFC